MYATLSGAKNTKLRRRARRAAGGGLPGGGSTGLPGNVPGTVQTKPLPFRRKPATGKGKGKLQLEVLGAIRAQQAGDDGPLRALRAEHGNRLRKLPGRVGQLARRAFDGDPASAPDAGGDEVNKRRIRKMRRELANAKNPAQRRNLRRRIRAAAGGGVGPDPSGGAPVIVDDGETSEGAVTTGDPELDRILARMDGLEELLQLKGKGKKKIKLKIGKLKQIFGDQYKAKGKRAAAGSGDVQTGGQYAAEGATILKAADDLEYEATDKSRYVAPGATGVFGRGQIAYGADLPLDYYDGGEVDPGFFDPTLLDPSLFDPGLYEPPGTFFPGAFPDYGGGDAYDSFVLPSGPTFADEFDGYGDAYEDEPFFYAPEHSYGSVIANKPLPGGGGGWGSGGGMPGDLLPMDFGPGYFTSVPNTEYTFEEIDFGGSDQTLFPVPWGMLPQGSPPMQEGDELINSSFDAMFPTDYAPEGAFLDWDENTYTGVYDLPYTDVYDYGAGPGIDQKWLMTDEEAQAALGLLGDQLSDADSLMVRLLPRFKRMERAATTPDERKKVAVLRGVLKEYTSHRSALRDGLHVAEGDGGLSGIPFLGMVRALGGIHGIGITAALVIFSTFVGGGVKEATTSVGTGLKWGVGIIVPMIGVLIGARMLGGKKVLGI